MSELSMSSTDQYTPRIAAKAGTLRGIFFVLVIMGLWVSASRTEAKEIPADQANFVFYAPGLTGGVFERTLSTWGDTTSGKWLAEYPVAVVYHVFLGTIFAPI